MKGVMLGVVGIGGIGGAALMGAGGGGPDDFIRTVNRPPQAVYAAFSALGREGDVAIPTGNGWGARVVQRVVKVPNEQVKLEVLVDGEALVTAEVRFAPDGTGTRVAAELDFNDRLLKRIVEEQRPGDSGADLRLPGLHDRPGVRAGDGRDGRPDRGGAAALLAGGDAGAMGERRGRAGEPADGDPAERLPAAPGGAAAARRSAGARPQCGGAAAERIVRSRQVGEAG